MCPIRRFTIGVHFVLSTGAGGMNENLLQAKIFACLLNCRTWLLLVDYQKNEMTPWPPSPLHLPQFPLPNQSSFYSKMKNNWTVNNKFVYKYIDVKMQIWWGHITNALTTMLSIYCSLMSSILNDVPGLKFWAMSEINRATWMNVTYFGHGLCHALCSEVGGAYPGCPHVPQSLNR